MAISKTAGTKFFISPTTANPDTIRAMSDAAAVAYFAAISNWIEVQEVEEYGELGDVSEEITFTSVGDRRIRKLKGPRNAGTQSVTVGRDPLDAGQVQMIVAQKTDFNYPVRIVMEDQQTTGWSGSTLYYAGLVISRPTNLANVSAVTRLTFQIGINTPIYEVVSGAPVAPANLLLPSISGLPVVGQTLTANEGVWSNSPTGFTYQWQLIAANIGGATSKTYVPITGQIGSGIQVVVTATNGAGSVASTSGRTAIVA